MTLFKNSNDFLKVTYDSKVDILCLQIPGRRIATSGCVTAPLVIDFGSEEDGFDVVGFELHKASEYLSPMLEALIPAPLNQG
jgi:uncharacterized protein YuzE